MLNKILKNIKKLIVSEIERCEKSRRVVLKDAENIAENFTDLDLRIIGLFSDVDQEKTAELTQLLIYLNEVNKIEKDPEKKKPIDFYISTYGGSADDMFALYDLMNIVKEDTDIVQLVKIKDEKGKDYSIEEFLDIVSKLNIVKK